MYTDGFSFRGLGLEDWTFDPILNVADVTAAKIPTLLGRKNYQLIADLSDWPEIGQVDRRNMPRHIHTCTDIDDLSTCTQNGCLDIENQRDQSLCDGRVVIPRMGGPCVRPRGLVGQPAAIPAEQSARTTSPHKVQRRALNTNEQTVRLARGEPKRNKQS